MLTEAPKKVSPESFLATLKLNVDNEGLSDDLFRRFIKMNLPDVDIDLSEYSTLES